MYHRSDCFSIGKAFLHFARDDGSIMEYQSEYPFLLKRHISSENIANERQLCDIRTIGSTLFLIYVHKTKDSKTRLAVANDIQAGRSVITVFTPYAPSMFTFSIDEALNAHITFFGTVPNKLQFLASHFIQLNMAEPSLGYDLGDALSPDNASFHVALPDEGICDVLVTASIVAILTPSRVILYDVTDRAMDPCQLFIPETDVSKVEHGYQAFGGIQHPLLQAYRLFYIKSTLLILTPCCLYRVEQLPDRTNMLTMVSKISSRILTYSVAPHALCICTSSYTLILVYASPDTDYLNVSVYNLANDVHNRLFSISLDYLASVGGNSESALIEGLPPIWPAIPNPFGIQMDRYMDGLVTKRCVRCGTTNILSTFPSRPSHNNIRVLLTSHQGTADLLLTLIHLNAPTTTSDSSSDFTIVASLIHRVTLVSQQECITKVEELINAEKTFFKTKSSFFRTSVRDTISSSVDLNTGSNAVAAISEGIFIKQSYLTTNPIVYYLHLLLNINVTICIALSKFLVTNTHFNNIRVVRKAKLNILYDILTIRDDLLYRLTEEWKNIQTLSSVKLDAIAYNLLAAYHNQDIPGLYTYLYYDPQNWLNISPPSFHSGSRLLSLFMFAFTTGLSLYDLTNALLLKPSPRYYTNTFTSIDTTSLFDYVFAFRSSIFYAEFRLIAWALSSQYRFNLGGKCSESLPCLSENVQFNKSLVSKIDAKSLKWMVLSSNTGVPHESVYEAGGTLHHTMFLTSCHVPMDISIFTQFNEEVVKQINQYAVRLVNNDSQARNFYMPHTYYIGTSTTSEEGKQTSTSNSKLPSSLPGGGPAGGKLISGQSSLYHKLYCRFDTRMSLREFIRRFVPEFDVIMSILSSLFGVLLDVVRTQNNRAKYTLRMVNLDTVFIEFTSLSGFHNMYYLGKDLESSPYRISLPFYSLGPDPSSLFPSRGSVPILLGDSAHICSDYYPSLLLAGLVAQLFFELLQIYTSGMLSSYDYFDLLKLSNVIEHCDNNGIITYTPGPFVSKKNQTGNLYNPLMCDASTAFNTLLHTKAHPYQRLLYLNNIFLNIHLLAKLDIELVIKTIYQSYSRMASQQFTILTLLKVYDLFCHAAANIIENPTELHVTLKVLQERFGTHMQYYDAIFESNLSINQTDFLEYVAFCKGKIPPFLLHLYDKAPARDLIIVVESLLYSNEDLMYRQQIVNNYKSDPVYQEKLKEDPNHPIVRLKEAILELRLQRKYRVPCTITKNKILCGMLEACMNATPITQMVCVTYENDPGIDAGGIFRSMISQCFLELLNEEEINGSAILNMVEHTLIPAFLGYTPMASSEVYPRLSQKRSALYYLGRLFAFAVVYNVRFPRVFDSRLISCLIGGRLYLDDELNEKYKKERENDPMFEINGTPVNLLHPINTQFYKKYYSSADKVFMFALERLYAEGHARGYITLPPEKLKDFTYLVSELKSIPDYEVPDILDDLAIPDFIIETRKLTNMKNRVLKWIISLYNDVKSGESFKKHLSEFRNGFRQPFGNTMSQRTDDRVKDVCLRIDKAFSEISLHDFEALFMADPSIDRKLVAEIIQPYLKSDPLEDLRASKQNIKNRRKILSNSVAFLKEVILNPKLMDTTALGDFLYAATGSRYTIGITLYVKIHNDGPLVIFHTCNNVIELPSCVETAEQMHKVLSFSMYEAVHGGFSIV